MAVSLIAFTFPSFPHAPPGDSAHAWIEVCRHVIMVGASGVHSPSPVAARIAKGAIMEELKQIGDYLPFLIPIALIQVGLMVAALLDVPKRPSTRLLSRNWWIVIIVLVNIVGPVFYFVAGREE